MDPSATTPIIERCALHWLTGAEAFTAAGSILGFLRPGQEAFAAKRRYSRCCWSCAFIAAGASPWVPRRTVHPGEQRSFPIRWRQWCPCYPSDRDLGRCRGIAVHRQRQAPRVGDRAEPRNGDGRRTDPRLGERGIECCRCRRSRELCPSCSNCITACGLRRHCDMAGEKPPAQPREAMQSPGPADSGRGASGHRLLRRPSPRLPGLGGHQLACHPGREEDDSPSRSSGSAPTSGSVPVHRPSRPGAAGRRCCSSSRWSWCWEAPWARRPHGAGSR